MKMKLCVCMIIAICAGQSYANLIQNGSFESGVNPGGSFSTLYAVNYDITGWKVTNNSIDYIGGYWYPSNGDRSLDLSGYAAGTISQEFKTVEGQKYEVTFDMSGNPDAGIRDAEFITKTLQVSAGAESLKFDYIMTAANSKTNMLWQEMVWSFTATSALTTLTFDSLELNPYGPALDNVNVSVVPLPATILLGFLGLGVGGWKLRKSI